MQNNTIVSGTKGQTSRTPRTSGNKPGQKPAMSSGRNEYVTRHLACVDRVVKRLARRLPRHVDQDDMRSAGMIGLIEAAERFDPARNDNFEAFAEFRIRGAILDDLRSRDSLSRDMRRVCSELRDASVKLANQMGRNPTESDLAKHLGVSVEEVRERQAKLSGWSVVGWDEAGPAFLERTRDTQALDPCEETAHRQTYERMIACIARLPERMQQVLGLYYSEDLNLREIGQVLGVTESRVCQIHGEATRRLRRLLGDDFAEAFAA